MSGGGILGGGIAFVIPPAGMEVVAVQQSDDGVHWEDAAMSETPREYCDRCGSELTEGAPRVRCFNSYDGKPVHESLMRCPRWRWWHFMPTPHARVWRFAEAPE